MCITFSFFFDTILNFSNKSCSNFCCLFYIFNYIILNNIFLHDIVTYLLLQPIFIFIKLHSFFMCNVLCTKISMPRGVQVFRFIPCSSRSSFLFLLFRCFSIIVIKYNIMFFIVVILQFIPDLLFFWLDFICYFSFFIIYYFNFDNVSLILCRLIIFHVLLVLTRLEIILILFYMPNYFIIVSHIW